MINRARWTSPLTDTAPAQETLPAGYEMYEGKPMRVLNGDQGGWWRFHNHYDRNGYCDNPNRGY